MRFNTLAGLGTAALLLAGTASVIGHGISPANAASRSDGKALKKAADEAGKAGKALASKKWDEAVRHAELAVSLNPDDAGYRATLGAAYLRAGRFASAHQAFADVMTLQPDNGRAALNLSLAQIAEGKWDEARRTLADHQAQITPTDRGLALALAGDPAGGVEVLTAATRSPDATAKTRQNLALAFALAGRWQEARSLVGVDMAPVEADARIQQWAVFAKPSSASDQVASLLGVTPAVDPGQPVSIALSAPVRVGAAEQSGASIDAYMPGGQPTMADGAVAAEAPAAAAPLPAYRDVATAVTVTPATATPAAVAAAMPVERFYMPRLRTPAARAVARETKGVQPRLIASPGAYKTAVAATPSAKPVLAKPAATKAPVQLAAARRAAPVKKGNWFVQLGAYANANVARDDWTRATRRFPSFASYQPAGMNATVKGGAFYRMSVGGFARGDAGALCRSYRAKGGKCFVRVGAGDQVAAWHKPATPVQSAKVVVKKPLAVAKTTPRKPAPGKKPIEVASR